MDWFSNKSHDFYTLMIGIFISFQKRVLMPIVKLGLNSTKGLKCIIDL